MNFSLAALRSRQMMSSSPLFVTQPHMLSCSLKFSSFSHSISPILRISGRVYASIEENAFSYCLSTTVILKELYNFTTISTKQAPSSSCTFSYDIFYQITSSTMGGGMLVSSASLNVSLHSCKFIQCYTTSFGFSAGGLSVYQANNFVMECCLFDNCSSTASDTNSFQINSISSATQYCSVCRICDINGGLISSNGRESLVGGSSGLSYSNHNITSAHSSGFGGFVYVILSPANSDIGLFSICKNCIATFDMSPYYLNLPVTMEYMNVINTTGNSYILYSTDSTVEVTLVKCLFVYSQSVSLTSFTASASYWAAFINCSFSFTPSAAQISGNTISAVVKYNASAGDANTGSISPFLTCFLYSYSRVFTSPVNVRLSNNLVSVVALLLIASQMIEH